MPSYKLLYFPIRARGEVVRFVFAQAGKEYENVRIPFDEWPKHKKNMPFRQLPVLEVDGRKLAQGYSIARFLAKEFGLAGKDKWEEADADQYVGVVEDLFLPIVQYNFTEDATAKAAALKKFLEETGPNYLEPLEEIITKSKSGFLVGSGVTYADLAFLGLFEFIESVLKEDGATLMKRFPNLPKYRNRIAALPKIAKYIRERPQTKV